MQRKLNVGIVGGGFGSYGLIPAFKLDKRCQIISICTKTIEKGIEVSKKYKIKNYYTSYAEMIKNDNLDILAIATVPSIQEEIIKYAAEKKINIFCEKPAATNYNNVQYINNTIKKNKIKSCIDFPFIEIDEFKMLRQKIISGELGAINECHIKWIFFAHHLKYNINSWKMRKNEGGGLLAIYASHTLNYIEYFFGEIFEFLILKYNNTELTIKFRTKNCLIVNFELRIDSEDQQLHRISVNGTKNNAILETYNALRFSDFQLNEKMEESKGLKNQQEDKRYLIVSKLVHKFIDSIINKRDDNNNNFDKAVRNQFLIQNIDECLKINKWTNLLKKF